MRNYSLFKFNFKHLKSQIQTEFFQISYRKDEMLDSVLEPCKTISIPFEVRFR